MTVLEPFKVKNIAFCNRIVMAPMVPFGVRELESGIMSDELTEHYLKRVENNMGLLIIQTLSVTQTDIYANGVGIYRTGIFSEEHKVPLKHIAENFHAHGSKVFVQLGYPSENYDSGASINEISTDKMFRIKNEFIAAARRCKDAGCDGIELHGAHGFFLNMITSEKSNRRKDCYGGDFNNRLRLVREIVSGIQEFTTDDFIISYRFGGCNNLDVDICMAQALEQMGIEMLHVSSGIAMEQSLSLSSDFEYNEIVYSGIEIRKSVRIPVIAVNDIQTIERADYLIENNLIDFTAFGKPFLADDLFLVHALNQTNYAPCLNCKNCQWFMSGEHCPARIKLKKKKSF
ncbi:oxidoreductase [Bacteroides thetaiotaomicron]|uniref:oxidoreductase n=1 Tax=Bacteroides thetaiotaomicron TaxID=818 RepID=UPI004064356A